MSLILASSSEGRAKLLTLARVFFTAIPSSLDEEKIVGRTPEETVELRAKLKGEDVVKKILSDQGVNENVLILSADSGAIVGEKLLGKPKDHKDAVSILKLLSGAVHKFNTSVYLYRIENKNYKLLENFTDTSYVTFRELVEQDIEEFLIHTDYKKYAGSYALFIPPFCKAPSYEDLTRGASILELENKLCKSNYQHFVTRIEGSISNVIGLPMERVGKMVRKYGISVGR